MKNIYFIRHAESEANAGGVSQPNKEINLTTTGRLQAERVAREIAITPTKIYISEYNRTLQTATPLLRKWQLTATTLACLNEFNALCYQVIRGLNGEQRLPITLQYWQKADPDWRHGDTAQTFNEFYQQVFSFNQQIKNIPDNSVIFTHGMWLALYIWQCLGFSGKYDKVTEMQLFRKFQSGLPMANTALYHLQWDNNLQFNKVEYIRNFTEAKNRM